ncbi:hypothetical protein NQ317_011059 [Molorchus minor]|uniref:Endonuclease/exonuclease/phosphatase domain-containing protein n=1 Tax=Molorchus minor TaxID=1323400 RepID=A0ABQ9IQQ2_9CUCU|nr:hypothetical protein NQ317_011059 [Molorchus minor]
MPEIQIINAFRLGKSSNEKRPVVLQILSYTAKLDILKNRAKLKGTGIFVNEDLIKEDRENRQILVKKLKEARTNNKEARIKGKNIIIDGISYNSKQLQNELDNENSQTNGYYSPPTPRQINSEPATPTTSQFQNYNKENSDEDAEDQDVNGLRLQKKKGEFTSGTPKTESDMNINIKSNKEYCNEYLNLLNEAGYTSLINEYTRVRNGSKSCIDHIFVKNKKISKYNSFIYKTDITDHYPVISLMSIQNRDETEKSKSKQITYLNEEHLKNIIKDELWEDIYEYDNLDVAVDEFIKKIQSAVELSTTKNNIKNRIKKRQPWITSALVTSVQRKQELYKQFQQDLNNKEKEREYKKFKKQTK